MRPIKLFLTLIVLYLVSIALHEWGHYWTAWAFDVHGKVTYPYFSGGLFTYAADIPTWQEYIIAGGGGFTVAAIYTLLWLMAAGTNSLIDFEYEFAFGVVGLMQLLYGFTEIGVKAGGSNWLLAIPVVVPLIVGVLYVKYLESYLQKGVQVDDR